MKSKCLLNIEKGDRVFIIFNNGNYREYRINSKMVCDGLIWLEGDKEDITKIYIPYDYRECATCPDYSTNRIMYFDMNYLKDALEACINHILSGYSEGSNSMDMNRLIQYNLLLKELEEDEENVL